MTGQIKTPYYIIHEDKLRRNLELISHVSEQSGAKIMCMRIARCTQTPR